MKSDIRLHVARINEAPLVVIRRVSAIVIVLLNPFNIDRNVMEST